jgi:hypothetical protein
MKQIMMKTAEYINPKECFGMINGRKAMEEK